MNKLIQLIILGSFLNFSVKGQDLKKITSDDKFFRTKEVYFVLKDNFEIRQGDYKRTARKIKTKGQYDNNKRTGIWNSFDEKEKLIQTINFSNNKVTPNNFSISEKYWIKKDDNFIEIKPDQAPAFIGGINVLYGFIWSALRYPADARRSGTEGKVFVSVTISKDGKIIDEKIDKGIGYGADEEALRIMQLIPDEWVPGIVNGEPTDMKILIPITFKLG